MRIPEHLFDEIKYKERHRLAVKKQLKPKAFSEVFSTVFLCHAHAAPFASLVSAAEQFAAAQPEPEEVHARAACTCTYTHS